MSALRALLLALLCGSALLACKPPSDSSNDSVLKPKGGQDGGGGGVQRSKPEEVKAAIENAVRLATISDPRRNFVIQFVSNLPDISDDYADGPEFLLDRGLLFPALKKSELKVFKFSKPETAELFKSPVLDALKNKQIKYLDKGNCPSPDNDHADASVTKLDLSGEICFSLDSLSRLAPSTLQTKIFGLLLHEIVHLAGADEKTAMEWQEHFDIYFLQRIGAVHSLELYIRTLMHQIKGWTTLNWSNNIARKQPDDPRLLAMITLFAQHMAASPYYLDPLALEINLRPARPDLVNNYSNAILAVIEKAWETLNIADMSTGKFKGPPLQGEQLHKVIKELLRDMDIVMNNFTAYYEGKGKSTCLLPTRGGFRYLHFGGPAWHSSSLESALEDNSPPRVCDPE